MLLSPTGGETKGVWLDGEGRLALTKRTLRVSIQIDLTPGGGQDDEDQAARAPGRSTPVPEGPNFGFDSMPVYKMACATGR